MHLISEEDWTAFKNVYLDMEHEIKTFKDSVEGYLGGHPELCAGPQPKIHSTKSRLKSVDHLREKIGRKLSEGRCINPDSLLQVVTDLAGVRILHLFQSDIESIHRVIHRKVDAGDWHFHERPKALTWDPETVPFFEGLGLDVQSRETAYTSVHYVVRPRSDSPLSCEIQVRTLFEEIWGEVDHRINYPAKTDSIAAREQLRVLSKIVGAGSRLLDSIERTLAHDANL